MGHYNTVKKGDPFRPSATLENEVRRFFNGGATISGGKSKAGNPNNIRISALNATTQEIGAYVPVAISHNDEKDYFYIDPTSGDTGLWGITTGKISPQSSGAVVVSGIVNAMIAPGSGDFAVPNNGVLHRASSGNARVLYGGDFENDKPGMILLGGTSGNSEYNGYFKLLAVPVITAEGQNAFIVRIVDGASYNPDTGNSGVNRMKVNGRFTSVAPYSSEPLTNGSYDFFVRFSLGDDEPVIIISSFNSADSKNIENSEFIGSVHIENKTAIVTQRALGMIHLISFAPCGETSEDEDIDEQ